VSQHPILQVPSAEPTATSSPLPTISATGEPWNVMREKAGIAAGINAYVEIKTEFDQNIATPPPPPPQDAPTIVRISAGRRIVPDPAKYIVDRTVGDRESRLRRP
jgi:hypothetical protein